MAQRTDRSVIDDALKFFDSLPDSANVRLPVVQSLNACSAATVWRMVKRGTLPAPRKLSERVTAWNVGELRERLPKGEDNQRSTSTLELARGHWATIYTSTLPEIKQDHQKLRKMAHIAERDGAAK